MKLEESQSVPAAALIDLLANYALLSALLGRSNVANWNALKFIQGCRQWQRFVCTSNTRMSISPNLFFLPFCPNSMLPTASSAFLLSLCKLHLPYLQRLRPTFSIFALLADQSGQCLLTVKIRQQWRPIWPMELEECLTSVPLLGRLKSSEFFFLNMLTVSLDLTRSWIVLIAVAISRGRAISHVI